ncbi:hypothetical protein GCK72_024467 [Caenorhabditis remanei]|uniref:Uncharacterized protein n=1 Tax=Caenorhabditis remanei TaxID=31234 RepID=A0A6A5FZ82_CAERE|nr:hypothetical protein GCK72_024467 [Caenorhabditis remanei]KAF1748000.1 hypothetical protein GCK72_024467 [Caenorhabditis remanei]
MQKSITDMVQKQVEKEKSLKRKERSMLKTSATRETSEEVTTTEMKLEELDGNTILKNLKIPMPENPMTFENLRELTPKIEPVASGMSDLQETLMKFITSSKSTEPIREKSLTPIKKKSPKISREPTPSNNGTPQKIMPSSSNIESITSEVSDRIPLEVPSNSHNVNLTEKQRLPPVSLDVPSTSVSTVIPPTPASQGKDVMQHRPEKMVTTLDQGTLQNFNSLKSHKSLTGVDLVAVESEAMSLPHSWNQQKVMRESVSSIGSHHNVSPTTSRQSSETDSSSSEGNRSFEAPLFDASASVSKSCQIPDYMIHRDTPQKIFIVANGFPAYFDEFPSRRH